MPTKLPRSRTPFSAPTEDTPVESFTDAQIKARHRMLRRRLRLLAIDSEVTYTRAIEQLVMR